MKYKTYSDLPNNIKSAIQQLEDPNPEALVHWKIPGAGNRSIIDLINTKDGEKKVLQVIQRMKAD